MANQLLQKIEASDSEGVLQLVKKRIIKDDRAWQVHLSLFPLVQRVLNPPYINPHWPKVHGIYRDFLPYLSEEDIPPLVALEINEYTQRPKAGEIPKTAHLHLNVSFSDIEKAIHDEDKKLSADYMYAFLEQNGAAELARRMLLLGSGYLAQSLGHSLSCTAFILLEMMERSDQDPWPVLASLADYFCQGWFHSTPGLRDTGLPDGEALHRHLLKAGRGSSIVDLHHTITFYSIERVRSLLSEAEYAHMIASWIEFMGAKSIEAPSPVSEAETITDYAEFYQHLLQRKAKPILSSLGTMASSPEGRKQLGNYLIKGVRDLYRGDYDPHFLTGLASALWMVDHYWDHPAVAVNALRQYLAYYFAR